MKDIVFIALALLMFSCASEVKKENIVITKGKAPEKSEMAALMLLMYDLNAAKEFPKEFLKIHTAELTDPSDRKPEFKAYSNHYLENLRKIFEPNQDSLKSKYNNIINSCIACHQTTCIGPIPKIKKLLIQ